MSALGDEWIPDEDGYPHRDAARIVLFDESGRILLARGHDRDQPSRQWWFTIGGGIMPGESPRDAAARELFEETGIKVDASELIGPVLHRSAEFDFLSVTARQDEWFFIGRATTLEVTDVGWTDLERDVIDEQRWWDLEALEKEATVNEIYPRALVDFARDWWAGWNGELAWVTEK